MKDFKELKLIDLTEAEILYDALHHRLFGKEGLLETEKDQDKLFLIKNLYEELKRFVNSQYDD